MSAAVQNVKAKETKQSKKDIKRSIKCKILANKKILFIWNHKIWEIKEQENRINLESRK